MYCCTEAEGCLGEKLGDFALNPDAARRIDAFFDEVPDDEHADDDLTVRLDADDIDGWAIWDPVPIDPATIRTERVTINTPALRAAAAMLGVALAE